MSRVFFNGTPLVIIATVPSRSSVRPILLEQTERTRRCSKMEIERFITESEAKITSLQSQIDALVEVSNYERNTVAALRHLIAPIHKLPVELMAEIFLLAIRDDYTHIKDTFRISNVCSHWRQVADRTPRLWTGPIRVDLQSKGSDREEVYADGLKAWLARSAPLPVPVSFICSGWPQNVSPRISEEALSTSSRWCSVRVWQEPLSASFGSFVRRLAECRLDTLEELDLGKIEPDNDIPTTLFFSTVPRLRKLSLSIDSDSPKSTMPWAQLSDLTLFSHSPDIALEILAQCPALVSASVTTTGWSALPQFGTDMVALDRLHTLSLAFVRSAEHWMSFFDRLSAPALQKLSVDYDDTIDVVEWTEAPFTTFQLRSPNISQLELSCMTLTSDDLTAALRHSLSLTHLKLYGCRPCFDDALIGALHYEDGMDPLVPRLHSLSLDEMDDNDFTEELLVDMLVSRWWTETELASHPIPRAVARWTLVELGLVFPKRLVKRLRRNDFPVEFLY